MRVETFVVGDFQENCYLVIDEGTQRCAFIDPGADGARLVEAVRRSGAALEAIWLTHAHVDHVGGIAELRRAWPGVPIYLHPADRPLYDILDRQAAMYGLEFEVPPAPDLALTPGIPLQLGTLVFDVLHAPGHAPGLCVFHGHGVLFAGDLLFAGSIGRTDLPLSNPALMGGSLAIAAEMPDETIVYSGHGPETTIGEERRTNPFLNGLARVRAG